MQIPMSQVICLYEFKCMRSRAAILYSLKLIQYPIDIDSEEWKQAGASSWKSSQTWGGKFRARDHHKHPQ